MAWRGVRACFAYILTVLIILSQINLTVFATGHTFDISQGNIVISRGSINGTNKVSYGSNQVEDNIQLSQYITITGTSTTNTIKVTGGISANIILSGVNINSQADGVPALDLKGARDIGLTLAGGTQNILKSRHEAPAIYVPENHNRLIILGSGELEAHGGTSWPGIGGSQTGEIYIRSGIIKATGGDRGAGIGGGAQASGGTVTISGGTVTATGGLFATGIGRGGGVGGDSGTFSTTSYGSAIIHASSIDHQDGKQNNQWNGIIFEGDNGKVYKIGTGARGFSASTDLVIPRGKTLVVEDQISLVIPPGKTFTNNGTLQLKQWVPYGVLENYGTVINNNLIRNDGVIINGDDRHDAIFINNGRIEGNGSIRGRYGVPMSVPNPSIDYSGEQLTGLTANAEYKIKVGSATEQVKTANADGKIAIIPEWFNTTLSIKAKARNGYADSNAKEIYIKNRPDAPTRITGVNETVSGHSDGKITGTTIYMEYRSSNNPSWIDCQPYIIEQLASGDYEVRFKSRIV